MYLFDTEALSQIMRKSPSLDFIRRLASIPPEQQFTTSITIGEMVYGAYRSDRPEYFMEKLENLVWANIQVLSFDENSAKVYGKVRAEMEIRSVSLMEPDLRIASIALHYDLTVVTGNVRHFRKVPGLAVENWFG